jgi:uncharacterized protein YabN with tetrapyrrole methylase and pyrophosphatase domain
MPALALAAKLQRKALSAGIDLPDPGLEADAIVAGLGRVPLTEPEIGDLLFSLVSVARQLGFDPETALRARSVAFRQQVERHEQGR